MKEANKIGFIYTIEHLDANRRLKSREVVHNLIPTTGLNYLLTAGLLSGSQYANWYIGLFTADRTPVDSDTLATLIADCEESSDYGETDRPSVSFPSASSGSITTSLDPNEFTFSSDATITGGFLTSGITISGTSGLLISAVKFSSPKVMEADEILRVPVGISLTAI